MKTKNKKPAPKSEIKYSTPDPLSATRNGKIARLDRDTRESLNRRLKENHDTDDILDWLNAKPEVKEVLNKRFKGQAITHQNLSQWRMRGYREWVKQQCAYTELDKKQQEITEKGGNPYQLGYQMAQIHAAEYLATLSDLVATAPNAEARMKQLSKAMMEFRGWRRADYHAERMALERKKWQWHCQGIINEEEKKEEDTERRKIIGWLGRFIERGGKHRPWLDDILDSQYDLDLLHDLQQKAWKIEAKMAAKRAAKKSSESGVPNPKPGEPAHSPDLANGKKPVADNQGLAHSSAVERSAENERLVSGMSDEERKEFYKKYLGILLDLNAAGEDLRELGGYADAERKHAELKIAPKAEVQSPKSGEVEAKVQHSPFNVQHSQPDGDSEMSSEERREMGARALEMLYDLFHGGEDILAIESHDELLAKHAALKAKKEEIPTTAGKVGEEHNIQHPTSNSQHPVEGGKGGGEDNIQQPTSNIQHPVQAAEKGGLGDNIQHSINRGGDNLQPSNCNLQPSIDGPMTLEQANKVVDEWYQKARRLGGIVVNSWDVADLRAYLSQQPAAYYSLKTGKHEFRQPPTRDPRFDSASPWSKAWPYLAAERRANEKN